MTKKVYVGMSGGVDSSVAAALLQDQGYDVTGVYMKNWTTNVAGYTCSWQTDFQDAKRVAVQLGIPIKVYDFETQYRQRVVDIMLKEYKAGRTPNPDILCNQEIKFKLFLDMALKDGADMIATGHYAQVKNGKLFKAIDGNKDQTYFLYRVTTVALQKTIMPLGALTKPQVRIIAKQKKLATALKKDSQGICFIGEIPIAEFLIAELGQQSPGPIIDQHGKQVGTHDGAILYTIGQRHGFRVGGGLPYYVTGKHVGRNELYVTSDLQDEALWKNNLEIVDTHWINGAPDNKHHYSVCVRYRSEPVGVDKIQKLATNHFRLALTEDVKAVTPGQSAVIYCRNRCVGGGLIV
ncbi:MAG: tRNA 2-thiouridine(34) synthase MnmA [Candidatus Saccharimonadales bacterium]|jgi:tRNA-specific 2-thiouridylase